MRLHIAADVCFTHSGRLYHRFGKKESALRIPDRAHSSYTVWKYLHGLRAVLNREAMVVSAGKARVLMELDLRRLKTVVNTRFAHVIKD